MGAGKKTIDLAYEIDEIHKYLDFVNLMTYVDIPLIMYYFKLNEFY